jgi:uncharacterized membrane protein YesL
MQHARQAFGVIGRSFRLLWDNLATFVACNVFWFLLCLPVVTAPASFAALYYVAELASREKPIRPRDFFAGFRQYLVKGTLLGLINLAIIVVLLVNIVFYNQMQTTIGPILRVVWLVVCGFWVMAQVYLFPMLAVQLEPKILWALRNTAMLTLAQPLFTFFVALEMVALIVFSAILIAPFLFIGMSAVALLSCVALNNRLDTLGLRRKPADDTPTDAGVS